MSYNRITKTKSTPENTKIVYNGNGFAIFEKELIETFLEEHNRLWELENQIENGTLKFIPCKVGDKVYYETFINNGSQSVGVQPHEVKSIYTSIVTSNFSGYGYTIVELDEFGKTVFLTKAEAEKKLEELKGGAK